jgi:predicted phosphoribosyltransferase
VSTSDAVALAVGVGDAEGERLAVADGVADGATAVGLVAAVAAAEPDGIGVGVPAAHADVTSASRSTRLKRPAMFRASMGSARHMSRVVLTNKRAARRGLSHLVR